MKCVPVHHGIPAVLHLDEPWLHRHSENGALVRFDLFSNFHDKKEYDNYFVISREANMLATLKNKN